MKPFVTFVVPAYNVANYIEDCIYSILNQSEKDFKIVIVDDGSTDGETPHICKRFAEQYPDRIEAIFQQNKGLGGARNTGLISVDSKYVMFLDSDDFLDLNFIKYIKMFEKEYSEMQIDMIFTLPIIYDDLQKIFYDWHDVALFDRIFMHNPYCIPAINPDLYELEVSACRKLFSTEFLKRIDFKFDENLKYEDFFPHFYTLSLARNCLGFRGTSFYYRVNRVGQITSLRNSARLDIVKVLEKTYQYVASLNDIRIMRSFLRQSVVFTKWCISNSTPEIRAELVDKLSVFYAQLPKHIVDEYCKLEGSRRNKLYIKAIRSKFLTKYLKDYIYFELLKSVKNNV